MRGYKMTEVLSNINSLIPVLTGLFGLISAAIGAFFAVKNWITALKTKQSQEIWTLVMEIADKAMEDPCKPGNPREVTKEDFINLYRQAM